MEDGLEFIIGQMSRVPTQRLLAWVAAGSFASGAAMAALAILLLTDH
jgi:hypothetical protein